MVDFVGKLWDALPGIHPRGRIQFLYFIVAVCSTGAGVATSGWKLYSARQVGDLERQIGELKQRIGDLDRENTNLNHGRLQDALGELNHRITVQAPAEPLKENQRPESPPAPGSRPSAVEPSRPSPDDVEDAGAALRFAESAGEYFRRGDEVRAIEAYVSAAQALPRDLLNRREKFPTVDLNDRGARSTLLKAFQQLFTNTTIDRLREMTKGQ